MLHIMMRDPAEIYTKRGTPLILIATRLLFAAYFAFAVFTVETPLFPHSKQSYVWIIYLLVIYYLMERAYVFFGSKKIDLTFAFPLLLAVYSFNMVSILLDGQARFPLMNRAEHLLSFILLTYVVWIFFLKYLPQQVWREHQYYTALLVLSVTSTLGVINELAELILDALFNSGLVGHNMDTSLDLLMNTLGIGLFLSVRLILSTTEEHH